MTSQYFADKPIRAVIIIILLLLLGSFMVYGINNAISRSIYFFIIVFYFWNTKDNALGLALLFIMAQNPWGLFYYHPNNAFLLLTPTVGVSYNILFSIVIFVKYQFSAQFRNAQTKDYLRKFFKVFLFFFITLIIVGLYHGFSLASMFFLLNTVFTLLLFFSLTKMLNYEQMVKFNRIIFHFTIVFTAIVLVDTALRGWFLDKLVFGNTYGSASNISEDLVRLTGGFGIALYSSVISLYYLAKKSKEFKIYFLWVVYILSFLFIFNTATRGLILSSLFLLLLFFVYYFNKIASNIKIPILAFIITVIAFFILPDKVTENLVASYARLTTLEAIAEGDMTAGGTARRWNIRGPLVLTHFNESPIVGFGFSKTTAEYWDSHVGNHTLLLEGGVVGLSVIWLTIIVVVIFLYRIEKKAKEFQGIFVFGIAIMSLMLFHSTNQIFISFVRMPPFSAYILAMLFCQINAVIHFKKLNILKQQELNK